MTSVYVRGAMFGLIAVSLWASWIVAVRFGIRTSFTPWDITALRFVVAGTILVPYLLKKGAAVDRLGILGVTAIVLGAGGNTDTRRMADHSRLGRNGVDFRRCLRGERGATAGSTQPAGLNRPLRIG